MGVVVDDIVVGDFVLDGHIMPPKKASNDKGKQLFLDLVGRHLHMIYPLSSTHATMGLTYKLMLLENIGSN